MSMPFTDPEGYEKGHFKKIYEHKMFFSEDKKIEIRFENFVIKNGEKIKI